MNPFRQVYDAAIARNECEYEAIKCAKDFYADYIRNLVNSNYGDEYIFEKLREYTRMLDEVIAP